MLVLYWTRTSAEDVVPPVVTPRQQPAGMPGKARKRKVIVRDKVYEVSERAIPSLLRALATSGDAERVIRKVKRGSVVKTVEEWKPVTHKLQVTLEPFQFYEPMRQEFAARADEYMLAALEQIRRDYEDQINEEDAEILALFL